MNRGRYVLNQFMEAVLPYELDVCVNRYDGDKGAHHFKCRNQFIAMVFGQLTGRESLRDTVTCLAARQKTLYHLGMSGSVSRTSLARVNEQRDWRIWQDLAKTLIEKVQRDHYIKPRNIGTSRVYAIDATTIDLCLSLYKWATFRSTKAAVRIHTVLDLNSNIPVFVTITDGKKHESTELPNVYFEPGACYVMDRGYVHFAELYRIETNGATFVIRAKKNLGIDVIENRTCDAENGVLADQTVCIGTQHSALLYPKSARLVTYFDKELEREFRFLTNDFDLPAAEIAAIYKRRWMIELFFKWIKQHLKIKRFWGQSENAVRTQIWIAICTYVMAQIAKHKTKTDLSLYQILQILSVSVFDKIELNQLLTNSKNMPKEVEFCNQLILFDL